MADPKLRFHFHEPTVDTNLPLTDGTVEVEGFQLECVDSDADAWDQGFGALVGMKEQGAPYVCIPAFPNRKFRLSYIQVNAAAGIATTRDLAGRRVGIYAWNNTAGVWARGALQNYYGVDLADIKWVSAKPPGDRVPAGVQVDVLPRAGPDVDAQLDRLLVAGELDAVISPNVLPSISRRDPAVHRLFHQYKDEEQKYYRDTGIFPISHVVTLRTAFVDRHPEAPVALLRAYRRARDVAFDRVEGSDPQVLTVSWVSAMMAEQRELMGQDYWPYNVESNRRTLDAMMDFAFQQGLTRERLDYGSFFDQSAAILPGQ